MAEHQNDEQHSRHEDDRNELGCVEHNTPFGRFHYTQRNLREGVLFGHRFRDLLELLELYRQLGGLIVEI